MLSRQRSLSKVIDITSLYIARACPNSADLIDATTDLAALSETRKDNLRHLRTVSSMTFIPRMVFRLGEATAKLYRRDAA